MSGKKTTPNLFATKRSVPKKDAISVLPYSEEYRKKQAAQKVEQFKQADPIKQKVLRKQQVVQSNPFLETAERKVFTDRLDIEDGINKVKKETTVQGVPAHTPITKPDIAPVYTPPLNMANNTKFKVNTVTADAQKRIQDAANNNTLQTWFLDDGDALTENTRYADSEFPTIGKERLSGISNVDKVVIAIPNEDGSFSLYKYARPDDEYADAKDDTSRYGILMDTCSSYFDDKAKNYITEIEALDKELDAIQKTAVQTEDGLTLQQEDYDKYQALVARRQVVSGMYDDSANAYKEAYSKWLDKYNEANARLNAKGATADEYGFYESLKKRAQSGAIPGTDVDRLSKIERQLLEQYEERFKDGNINILPNEAYLKQINDAAVTFENAKKKSKENDVYTSDMYSAEQVNSFKDALVRQISRSAFGIDNGTNVVTDILSVFAQAVTNPYNYITDHWEEAGDITKLASDEIIEKYKDPKYANLSDAQKQIAISTESFIAARVPAYTNMLGTAAGIMLNNVFVNLAETFDISNYLVKPFVVGINMANDEVVLKENLKNNINLKKLYEDATQNHGELTVADRMGVNAWMDAWGANGTTPSYEYDMLWRSDETMGASGFVTQLALEIMFDPATWVNAGIKAAAAGQTTAINKLEDVLRATWTDAGIDVSEKMVSKYAKQIVSAAIVQGEQLQDVFLKKAMKGMKASNAGNPLAYAKHLESIPKNSALKFMDARKSQKLALTTAAAKAADNLPTSLGTSYKVIASLSTVPKVLNKIDSMIFAVSVPPILARNTLKGIRNLVTTVAATNSTKAKIIGSVTERIVNKLSNELAIGGSKSILTVQLGAAAELVSKEVNSVAHLLDNKILDEYTSSVVSGIAKRQSNIELTAFQSIMSSGKSADNTIAALDKYCADLTKGTSFAHVQSFPEYLKLMTQNIELYKTTFDNAAIARLRQLQKKYIILRADGRISKMKELKDVTDKAHTVIQSSLTDVPYRMLTFTYEGNGAGLKASYNRMVGEYKTLYNSIIDDFNPMSKQQTAAIFKEAHANLTTLFDTFTSAMYMSVSTERRKLVEDAFRKLSESNVKIHKLTNSYLDKIETQRINTALANYHNPIKDEVNTFEDMPDFTQNNLRDLCTTIAENLTQQTNVPIAPDKVLETLKHGVEDCLTADGALDTERLSRLYRIDLDKLSKSAAYINNPDLQKYTTELLDYKGVSYDTLWEAGHVLAGKEEHKEYVHALNTVYVKLCEYANHTELFKSVLALDSKGVDKVFITGFLDAIAGNAKYINRAFNELNYNSPGAISRVADKITDTVVDNAVDFIMGTHHMQTPNGDGVKLWRKGCNTVDTTQNVNKIEELLADINQKGIIEALEDVDDKYIDVVYSASMTNKHTIPFMLSFKVDGELSTFRNSDIPFAVKGSTESVYGVSFEDALAQYNQVVNTHAGVDEDEYLRMVDDYMYTLKTKAGKEGKQLRFIGFNNSTMGNNQDRYLELLVRRHVMDVHETMMIDIANVIRHENHIPVVPKETVAALRDTMEHAIEYGVGQNTLHDIPVAGLVSSPEDGIDSAIGILIREMDNARPVLQQGMILPTGLLGTAQEQLKNLRMAYRNSIHANTEAMEGLNGVFIDEYALRKLVEAESGNKIKPVRLNCMNLIRENIGHAFNYNLITDINTAHMKAWFDLAKVAPDYAPNHAAVQRLLTNLERTYNEVAYPELVEVISEQDYHDYANIFLELFENYARNTPGNDDKLFALKALNIAGMDKVQLYAVCADLRRSLPPKSVDNLDTAIRAKIEDVDFLVQEATDLLSAKGRTVVYDGARAKIVASRYASPVAQANEFSADMELLDTLAEQMHSFDGYLATLDSLYEDNRMLSPKERIKGTLFATVNTPFKDFVDSITSYAPRAEHYSIHADNPVFNAIQNNTYSKQFSEYKRMVGSFSKNHKQTVAMNVLSLNNADFTAHVIRNCKNALIINPRAEIFNDSRMTNLLYKKLDELKEQTELVVRYEDNVLKIYKDMSGLRGSELNTFLRTYDKAVVPSAYLNHQHGIQKMLEDGISEYKDAIVRANANPNIPFDKLGAIKDIYERSTTAKLYMSKEEFYQHVVEEARTHKAYAKLTDELSKYMPADYYFSTGDVITQDAVNSIYEMFPQEAHLDLGLINSGSGFRWFDDSFMCSIIGDSTDFKKVNPYYTDNVLSNIGAGIHHVRNNLEATTDYFALYDNPTQSLRHMIEASNIEPDFRSVKRSLVNNGYVLHKGEIAINKHGEQIWEIKQIKLDSRGDFINAMNDPRVICTPNEVLMQMKAFAKGETLAWRAENATNTRVHMMEMYNLWSQRVRSVRSTMWLFGVPFGAALRNRTGSGMNAYAAAGDVALFKYMGNATELNNRYGDIYADMLEEYGNVTGDIVHEYFYKYRDNPAKLKELDLDTFAQLFAHKESSAAGFSGAIDYMKENQSRKLVGLIPEHERALFTARPVLDDAGEISHVLYEEVESAQKIYQKVFNKYAHKVKKEAAIIKEEVRKALELSKLYSPEQIEILSKLYIYYIPSNDMAMEMIQRIPLAGKALSGYLNFNKKQFSAAEDVTRTGMAMYYADKFGMSMNRANQEVITSQFDYSNRSLGMDIIETLFPFSTFKIYNTAFWMFDAPNRFNAIRTMTKYGKAAQLEYDSEELMLLNRNMALREKIASGELNYQDNKEDAEQPGFLSSVLNAYTGVPSLYSENGGNIALGKNHVLKAGNTFVDALNMVQSIFMAIPELLSGQVPSIFADNIYAPISTLLQKVIPYMLMGEGADWDEVLRENYYDLFDLVPFLGGLVNLAMTHLKNGNLSVADLQAINTNPQLQDEYGYRLSESVLDVLGMVMPSVVGTVSEKQNYMDRPVGTNWYEQTDEYKKTHRYVFGISAVPSFFTKNPETYVHYYGLYTKMGYEEEEVGHILSWMFGTPKPQEYQYKDDEINAALESLADKGYSVDEAIRLIQRVWLGATNIEEVDDRIRNLAFLKKYDMLPDYIKYEDGQYAQLKAWYKAQGYTIEQMWSLMSTQNPYMDEQGDVRYLTQTQADELTASLNAEYVEYMDGLPDWMQYEPGASTRTIAYLLGNGIVADIDQASAYITANHFYVDAKGKAITYTDAENAAKEAASSTEFKSYYNSLPDYIKYEKGAFSRTISWLTKNGADNEEARAMIKDGAYLTVDGRLIDCRDLKSQNKFQKWGALTPEEIAEFQVYFAKLPDYIKYEKGAYKRILKHLMKQEGMSYEDAKAYMLNNFVDVDAKGNLIRYTQTDIDRMKNDKEAAFKAFYDSLPDYIKFEKGAYSRTYAHLKAQGYDKATIMEMIKNGAYLSMTNPSNPKIINVKGLKKPRRVRRPNRKYVNNYRARFKKQRKPFKNKRSFGRTYSATNSKRGHKFGAQTTQKITLGYNRTRTALGMASGLPASYRNVAHSNRKNMYREMYAKYGLSRMIIRSNAWHSYSNASITRLRRNEIKNKMKYQTRRSSF